MSDPSQPPYPHGQQPPHPDEQPAQPLPGQSAQPQGWGQPPAGQPPQGWGQPPQGWQPPYPMQYRTTNGLAIASLVLGIIWVYWLGSVLALVFGYVARKQIRERNQTGDGMAIAGIVLGWVGVAMLLLTIAVVVIAEVADPGSTAY